VNNGVMEEVVVKKKYGWVGAILAVVGLTFVLLSIYLVLYAPFCYCSGIENEALSKS